MIEIPIPDGPGFPLDAPSILIDSKIFIENM